MMFDTSIRRDEVFSQNRDELVMQRLEQHIGLLQSIGMDNETIRRTISGFPYVIVWVRTPKFLFPIHQLPDGLKWKDGQKTKAGETSIVFLPVENDLYIKGITTPGVNVNDPQMSVIRNFRLFDGTFVASSFDPQIAGEFLKFWKSQGLRVGLMEPVLLTPEQALERDLRTLLNRYVTEQRDFP